MTLLLECKNNDVSISFERGLAFAANLWNERWVNCLYTFSVMNFKWRRGVCLSSSWDSSLLPKKGDNLFTPFWAYFFHFSSMEDDRRRAVKSWLLRSSIQSILARGNCQKISKQSEAQFGTCFRYKVAKRLIDRWMRNTHTVLFAI